MENCTILENENDINNLYGFFTTYYHGNRGKQQMLLQKEILYKPSLQVKT